MGPPHISDDLLSAYLDGAVSEDERRLVEAALRSDAETAWRLNALQQTVLMLRALPQVKLPRAYSLTALLAAEQAAAAGMSSGATMESLPGAAHRPPAIPRRESAAARRQSARRGFWEALGAFFGSGNMALRNSAAAAFALFVVLLVGSQALVGTARIDSEAAPREMSTAAEMPLATAPTSVAVAAAGVQIESTPASVDEATPLVEAAPAQAASVADSARTASEESAAQPAAQEAAPTAMVADSPGAMEEAPMAETSSAAMAAAMAAPPGMGAEGMGGGNGGGPAAAPMPGLPAEASGGGEAMTGLDVAMAESAAGVAAVASSARVAPATAAPTPAAAETAPAAQAITPSVSADSAAPVANTNADGAAASAKSAPATAMPATVAPAAQAYAASTEAAVDLAPAAASASDAVYSSRAWGMSWLTAAALTAGGLALLLALLWVLSRRAPTQSTPRT